jgi:hypothetical protein
MTPDVRRELKRFIDSADPLISLLLRDIETAKFLLDNGNHPDLQNSFPIQTRTLESIDAVREPLVILSWLQTREEEKRHFPKL